MPDNFNWIDNNNIFTNMKHTPGPWIHQKLPAIYDEMHFDYRIIPKEGDKYDLICKVTDRTESQANAKLIAAAPEMYDLLLDMNMEGGHGLRVHERIRNILNKINT